MKYYVLICYTHDACDDGNICDTEILQISTKHIEEPKSNYLSPHSYEILEWEGEL